MTFSDSEDSEECIRELTDFTVTTILSKSSWNTTKKVIFQTNFIAFLETLESRPVLASFPPIAMLTCS